VPVKKAAANLLKSHAYDLAQSQADKAPFIELLYGLIMQAALDPRVKELLGGALEHLFNRDEGKLSAMQNASTKTW
jgi:hypothetical protein